MICQTKCDGDQFEKMFFSSQMTMMSDSDIADKLGDNIALEYVRDSPLFRQQLHAFEESGSGIAGYARG